MAPQADRGIAPSRKRAHLMPLMPAEACGWPADPGLAAEFEAGVGLAVLDRPVVRDGGPLDRVGTVTQCLDGEQQQLLTHLELVFAVGRFDDGRQEEVGETPQDFFFSRKDPQGSKVPPSDSCRMAAASHRCWAV